MLRARLPFPLVALIIIAAMIWSSAAFAVSEKVLYAFSYGKDGVNPVSSLVLDNAGNLYGTSYLGGTSNEGAVFKLAPKSGGGWTETVLYSFKYGTDGSLPVAGVVLDGGGNLYGTTSRGGLWGYGTVFELAREHGKWTESILYSFSGGNDGGEPQGGLLLDGTGNLYGTSLTGGAQGSGTAFELTPHAAGGWSESVLHSFGGGTDGVSPFAGLTSDSAGNLYGTTRAGGDQNYGTVFELTPGNGGWTEKILYSFKGRTNGQYPVAGLTIDKIGHLYGTTSDGGWGCRLCGLVFELRHTAGGWKEHAIHSFKGGYDGRGPAASLVLDAAGNLYGTTVEGGGSRCPRFGCGTVFSLTPSTGGGWTESVIYSFTGGKDGKVPYGGLALDAAGHLYGTTEFGGNQSGGAVFDLTLQATGNWRQSVIHSFAYGTNPVVPNGSLVIDSNGDLFGTTAGGGFGCGKFGCGGTVFELQPPQNGQWTESRIYGFHAAAGPAGSVTLDAAGNIYGATRLGGSGGNCGFLGCGTIFQLKNANGRWTESTLYSFLGVRVGDGEYPTGSLTFDQAGNLYGTTNSQLFPTVFELKNVGGNWTEKVLLTFGDWGSEGFQPNGGLIFDAAGNLYGTTAFTSYYGGYGTVYQCCWSELYKFTGGADGEYPDAGLTLGAAGDLYGTTAGGGSGTGCGGFGCGTVFKLTRNANGTWTQSVIYTFAGGTDGGGPEGGLVFDSAGNFYGTTYQGGGSGCGGYGCGTVFKLTPGTNGGWTESVVYSFADSNDGRFPSTGLILDPEGNLYGTTQYGGTFNGGVVFEIVP